MTATTAEAMPLEHPGKYLPGIAAAVITAGLLIDPGTVAERVRQSGTTDIVYNGNDGDQEFLTIPGLRTVTSTIAGPMLEKRFGQIANTAYLSYAKGKLDYKEIGKALLDYKEQHAKNRSVSVLALSMGGTIFKRLLDDLEFRDKFGPIDSLVFDSSPNQRSDIRLRPRLWLSAAGVISNSRVLDQISTRAQLASAHNNANQHDELVTDEDVIKHQEATIRRRAYEVTNQGKNIPGHYTQRHSLKRVAEKIYYLQSTYDSVIKTDPAFTRLNQEAEDTVKRVVDLSRAPGSHAAAPEYSDLPAALLAGSSLEKWGPDLFDAEKHLTNAA